MILLFNRYYMNFDMQNEFVMLVGYEVGEILMFNFKIVEKVMDSY